MTIEAEVETPSEPFQRARSKLDEMVARLRDGAMETLAMTEEYVRVEGLELQRLVLQGRLDVLFERERAELVSKARPAGVHKRARTRHIETQFGTVAEKRHGLRRAEKPSEFPMDEQLNVSADRYSYPVRRRVAEEVADGSFDQPRAGPPLFAHLELANRPWFTFALLRRGRRASPSCLSWRSRSRYDQRTRAGAPEDAAHVVSGSRDVARQA
jgi:hypothetical protein